MSSKRFAGEVIWGSCALGFNETCFGFCVFADGHVLATLSAIEGRTGLAISGVFGAGKTRSAAAKENVAAHAVAEHLVSLKLPDRIQGKIADWMSSVDLFLEDEGQQYGNMEEAASVARTPATRLDHRQTPGGLKKSKESKASRKKLTKRPLALRCQTQYTQAHDLEGIAMRYLDEGSFPWKIRQLRHRPCSCADLA